ncbi:YggS family pyridoxal phosphate-dependent enzyme [Achromobacter sp. F4_2707]|uniref:YggS family pyridoxal phosphate-dependent enzyme n=1 Tax=Achromobacter sp. F4_2707 TaxID=3114286 RepID=UPI0039C72A24
MTSPSSISTRLAQVKERIEALTLAAGRPAGSVTLLPVSKTFGTDAVQEAMAAGMQRFGENKAQDIRDKSKELAGSGAQWVMIGHLQTNKARDIARYAHEIQSLDRPELAQALERRLQLEGRSLDALVQVKTSTEPSKFGLDPVELEDFLAFLAREAPSLRVQGLMTMAVNDPDRDAVRACFRRLRELRDTMREKALPGISLERLSMGMSGDYDLAIAEGSTEVRIGSAIFGDRSYTSI